MSIVRADEFATYLGMTTPPSRAQSSLDIAESLVASYISMEYNQRGNALQEHTVSERITPIRDKAFLEVGGGPVTGIESIAYNRKGYRRTADEVTNETDSFDYVFNPDFSGWCVSGRNSDGGRYVFQKGAEYLVTYRTGWCAGASAYNWQFYRSAWGDALDRKGFTFSGGDETADNDAGDPVFGASTSTPDHWYYELGVETAGDALRSPAVSFEGSDFPFILVRSSLERASTTGNSVLNVRWLDGDGRNYETGKKTSERGRNYLPDRVRAHTLTGDHEGWRTDVIDMGFLAADYMKEQMESPNHSWRDATITSLFFTLWEDGADYPDGAKFGLDYIKVCDGTSRMPESIKNAVLETARAVRDGSSSGIQSESIGDYSKTMGAGEGSSAIPPIARKILDPYRRPSW